MKHWLVCDKQAFINLVVHVIHNFFSKTIPCILKSCTHSVLFQLFFIFFSIYLQKTPKPWSWLVLGRTNSRRRKTLSWRARSWRSSMTRSTGRRSYAPPSWKSWSKPGLKPGRLRRCITYVFVFCLFYDSAASKILFQAALKEPFIGINTMVEKFEFCWGQFLFLIFHRFMGTKFCWYIHMMYELILCFIISLKM